MGHSTLTQIKFLFSLLGVRKAQRPFVSPKHLKLYANGEELLDTRNLRSGHLISGQTTPEAGDIRLPGHNEVLVFHGQDPQSLERLNTMAEQNGIKTQCLQWLGVLTQDFLNGLCNCVNSHAANRDAAVEELKAHGLTHEM